MANRSTSPKLTPRSRTLLDVLLSVSAAAALAGCGGGGAGQAGTGGVGASTGTGAKTGSGTGGTAGIAGTGGTTPPGQPVGDADYTVSYRTGVRVPSDGTVMAAQAFVNQVNLLDPIAPFAVPSPTSPPSRPPPMRWAASPGPTR